jgi:hypothetical protein
MLDFEFKVGTVKYRFLLCERDTLVFYGSYDYMCIPRKYAKYLLTFAPERILSFLETNVHELVEFNESIEHVWCSRYSNYCLDIKCIDLYLEDQRLVDFFERWLSKLPVRVKPAHKI